MCVFFSFRVFFVLSFFERESIWCFARSCLHFINFSNVSYECKRKFWETNLIYTISKKAVKITKLPRISRQKNIVIVNKAVKSNAFTLLKVLKSLHVQEVAFKLMTAVESSRINFIL